MCWRHTTLFPGNVRHTEGGADVTEKASNPSSNWTTLGVREEGIKRKQSSCAKTCKLVLAKIQSGFWLTVWVCAHRYSLMSCSARTVHLHFLCDPFSLNPASNKNSGVILFSSHQEQNFSGHLGQEGEALKVVFCIWESMFPCKCCIGSNPTDT